MGAWGSYMPIGMALAMLGAPSVAGQFGLQGVWIAARGAGGRYYLPLS